MSKINYFKAMQTGLYDVFVDRTSLVTPTGMDSFVYTSKIGNDGSTVYVDEDIVKASINILTMIDIHDRGYSIQIKNKKFINEIIEVIYNHITACIEAKNNSIDNVFPVNVDDLVKMERFMLDVIKSNPITIKDTLLGDKAVKEKRLVSMFAESDVNTEETVVHEQFRRIGLSRDDDFSMEDLLNTLGD